MVRRIAWVAWQAVFLLAILVGFVLAVQDRSWARAAIFTFIAANVVWSLNWLPGRPGRLRRLVRRHRLRAENLLPIPDRGREVCRLMEDSHDGRHP